MATQEIIKLEHQRTEIEWTPYMATAYAEGFCEGENATLEEQIEAWACLIKTGLCWNLQGWFGRQANALIEEGLISKEGEVYWEEVDSRL
jgi:hypothetical protein